MKRISGFKAALLCIVSVFLCLFVMTSACSLGLYANRKINILEFDTGFYDTWSSNDYCEEVYAVEADSVTTATSTGFTASTTSIYTNSYQDGEYGLRIPVDYTVYDLSGRSLRFRMTLWDSDNTGGVYYDGNILEDTYYFNPSSNSYSGSATFFFPNYKLRGSGQHDFTFDIQLIDNYSNDTVHRENNIASFNLTDEEMSN